MWQLQKIEATNLCAFEKFDYCLNQEQTTLIFGNNMDDDSQNSNGSGKSALIEAIAIAITGETLRKVNMDEIINDAHDVATVLAVLFNQENGLTLTVNRKISRKQPQEISILSECNGECVDVKQATVADYNKYILDKLGLSKDDIFSNFILTAKKYRSFLSSSDREKKDLINRFSNGVMVDESIEALHVDMEPIQDELNEAIKNVASLNGSISAMSSEIERAINESADRSANKKARIEGWKQAIVDKRAEIRSKKQSIEEINKKLDELDGLDERMQKLEKNQISFRDKYRIIKDDLKSLGLSEIEDYVSEYDELQKRLDGIKENIKSTESELSDVKKEMQKASKAYDKLSASHDKDMANVKAEYVAITNKINELGSRIKALQVEENEKNSQKRRLYDAISSLDKQLAGVIECPKCGHEFTLKGDLNIDEARLQKKNNEDEIKDLDLQIEQIQQAYNKGVEDGKQARQTQNDIADKTMKINEEFNNASIALTTVKTKFDKIDNELQSLQNNMEFVQKRLSAKSKDMFDEVFDVIDQAIKSSEMNIQAIETSISNLKGAIESYEESIKEAENAVETDVIASLKESKAKYEKSLQKAIKVQEEIEQKLNALKIQEATFLEFKTHLANTKIDAISQITNDFLETIGSDIRLSLSGFTVLKSGKIRDKISISLIRDGVDCGSFDKFSRGEQTRVELACILAMNKLINMNCHDDQGLNLLVIDEILDATDEGGLTNIFKALNETCITSLVVSHGNIAENYPNRLIVNKQNGISFIE